MLAVAAYTPLRNAKAVSDFSARLAAKQRVFDSGPLWVFTDLAVLHVASHSRNSQQFHLVFAVL